MERTPETPDIEARDVEGPHASSVESAKAEEPVVEEETAEEAVSAVEGVQVVEEGEAKEPVESIEDAIRARDELAEKLAQEHDRLLRLAADFDNFRKRSMRQEAETAARVRADTIRSLLPVMDNIERAIAHAESVRTVDGIIEGLRLVEKQFLEILARDGIVRLEPSVGKPFDPTLHEAVSQIEAADVAPGSIVTELQAGYVVGERLLRPALVVVARAPRAKAGEPSTVLREGEATPVEEPWTSAKEEIPRSEPDETSEEKAGEAASESRSDERN